MCLDLPQTPMFSSKDWSVFVFIYIIYSRGAQSFSGGGPKLQSNSGPRAKKLNSSLLYRIVLLRCKMIP